MRKRSALLLLLVFLAACTSSPEEQPVSEVVRVLPFDDSIFTQGLEMQGEHLLVSGGLYGESFAGIYAPEEETLLVREALPAAYFGEGLTLAGDRVLQLSWRENTMFIRNPESLKETGTVHYDGEGWGIAMGGDVLYMSDGTDAIRRLDPVTLAESDRFTVTENGNPVPLLNELEYANGKIYANIWQTDDIVRIHPDTGQVEQRYDFTGLLSDSERERADVLNGIAHIDDDRFYITGKHWPKLFEVILR